MSDKRALTEAELDAIVAQQIELAKSHFSKGGRETDANKALDYYFGRMDSYVPPEVNRSKVVSRDVADTIGWLMPQIMRVFTASGRMFQAEAAEPDDLQYADVVSDGLNYVFWKDNKGYEVVYAATWDCLLHGDGIVKTYYEEEPVYGAARYHEGLTADQLGMMLSDDAMEVLAQTKRETQVPGQPDPITGAPGQPEDVTVHDVKVRRKKADGRFCVTVIPPEEFLIDSDATSIEDAAFKAHWQKKSRSDLVAMGYDKDVIWEVTEAARVETAANQARRAFTDADQTTDKSTQLVDYFECFVMIDADGDGVAEMLRVCRAGPMGQGKILHWEVWDDEDPFDNIPCEPIPHRFGARSVADEETDVQDVKTVLSRNLLNNIYWGNNPLRFVAGKVKNPEMLNSPVFGGTVFADTGTTVANLDVADNAPIALQGIAYMDEVSARRTGVNAQSMALDPEVLQNQSATASQNATDASRSQPELIARNMAEYGWTKVGRKLLRLMNRHQAGPRVILVKGKPVPIDPRNWNPDMHINVNTGLGTGSRDRDAMMLNQVLQQQIAYTDRIGQVFPEKAVDMLPFIHNTLTRFAESTGLQNPELYWPEINQQELDQGKQKLIAKQGQPDPAMQMEQMKGQVQMQLKQADVAAQQQIEQGRQQTQQQLNGLESERQIRQEQAQMQADLVTKDADRQNALQLESVKQQGAYNIEAMRIASQERMKQLELQHSAAMQREGHTNAQTLAAMKPAPGAPPN